MCSSDLVAAILVVGAIVFAFIAWRNQDRWRDLTTEKIDEFFNGKENECSDQSLNTEETNAWNFKYDMDYEIPSKELEIGKLQCSYFHSPHLHVFVPRLTDWQRPIRNGLPRDSQKAQVRQPARRNQEEQAISQQN